MSKTTIIDPIHDFIELSGISAKILNSYEFNRMAEISQLGNVTRVYPSASHTRKSHSIGTAHICSEWLKILSSKGVDINERVKELMIVSALCHDIGHVAFSHLFDDYIIPDIKCADCMKTHESRSAFLIKMMNIKYNYGINNKEIIFICNNIHGKETVGYHKWCCKLISGLVDSDRLDYLLRDSFFTGIPANFRLNRILLNTDIKEGKLVFNKKIINDIVQFSTTRRYFHSEIYKNKSVLKFNIMLREILVKHKEVFNIEEMLKSNKWLLLTDSYILSKLYENMHEPLIMDFFSRNLKQYIISDEKIKGKELLETVNINLGGKDDCPDVVSGLKFYNKKGIVKIDTDKLQCKTAETGWVRYIYIN